MIDETDFRPAFEAKLAEVEAQFADKAAEVEGARQAVDVAKDAAFVAAQRFEHFGLVVLRASRHSIAIGSDVRMLSLLTRPLDEIAEQELALKRAADMALTRAQKLLANYEWQLGDLRDAAKQLRLCINPLPIAAPQLQVVKRPARPAVDVDDVVMPAPRSAVA